MWSYGEDVKNIKASGVDVAVASRGAEAGSQWIRNGWAHAAESQPYF